MYASATATFLVLLAGTAQGSVLRGKKTGNGDESVTNASPVLRDLYAPESAAEDHSVASLDISATSWSGGAKGWLARFPKLQGTVQDASDEKRFAQIWMALGDNRWMEFIDGRAHAGGPHAWDAAKAKHEGRTSGNKTYQNQNKEYDRFSTEDAWMSRWTMDRLAVLNSFFRDLSCENPATCSEMFDPWSTYTPIDASEKREWLGRILAEYYDAIDAIRVPKTGVNHIHHALPFIARLFHKLALLHPFQNGNSRTRMMVLQTEMVRQGGHPIVLWDNYWGIYNAGGVEKDEYVPISVLENYTPMFMEAAQEFVLDGWCGWEVAYNKGASPFSPFVCDKGTLVSAPHSEYNSQTGTCEQGPPRSFWVPPFAKHHQSPWWPSGDNSSFQIVCDT